MLDGDDLLSPTSIEKALWVLEHDSTISICGWFTQEFGYSKKEWRAGHFDGKKNLEQNRLVYSQVVKTSGVKDCSASFKNMPNGM